MSKWKETIGRERIYNVNYPNTNVVHWDILKIKSEQRIRLEFISVNSPYRQGVRLAVDAGEGYIEINSVNCGKAVQLWQDTYPHSVEIKCISSEGILSVYNIFDRGVERGGVRSQLASCGMIVDDVNGEQIYRCNDSGFESNFDKLIFKIQLL